MSVALSEDGAMVTDIPADSQLLKSSSMTNGKNEEMSESQPPIVSKYDNIKLSKSQEMEGLSNGHCEKEESLENTEENIIDEKAKEILNPVTQPSDSNNIFVESDPEKISKYNGKDIKSRENTPLSDVSSLTPVRSRSTTPKCSEQMQDGQDEQKDVLPIATTNNKLSRSSEERSTDSSESSLGQRSTSAFKIKTTPKARKSGPPAKNVLPLSHVKCESSPGANVKINLPQFHNSITVDSKFLEKISKLGKKEKNLAKETSENINVKPVIKSRATLPINSQPKPIKEEKNDDSLLDSSLLEKDAFGKIKKRAKKRRKLGSYKLPSELKKKFGKKKDEDIKDEKDDDSLEDISKSVESTNKVTYTDLKSSSPQNGAKKSAFEKLKMTRLTPKSKNTLGSTRHRLTPPSVKSKAQTSLDSFLSRCDSKSSQTPVEQNKEVSVDDSKSAERRTGLRKRKKEEEDDENAEETEDDKKEADTNTGNKKKRKEDSIVISSPAMTISSPLHSLLTSNIKPSGVSNISASVNHNSSVTTTTQIKSTLTSVSAISSVISVSSPISAKPLTQTSTVASGEVSAVASLLPQNFPNLVPTINPSSSVALAAQPNRFSNLTRPTLVQRGHAPLILVPVRPVGNVVNTMPLSTSVGMIQTSLPNVSPVTVAPRIILSVPDPKLSNVNKLAAAQPRYILMRNVNNMTDLVQNTNVTTMIGLGRPPCINTAPQFSVGTHMNTILNTSSQANVASTSSLICNNSTFNKPSVINNLTQKLDALDKSQDELELTECESPAPSSPSYPVTPPKTPEDQRSNDSVSSAPPGPIPPDKDVIPLCCCKINGACFKKLGSSVTYCQALDSVDGKVMGCCNKVTNSQLVRPGVKIPFMAICEAHRKRLKLHNCCPGCGHFCTQGTFAQCQKPRDGVGSSKCPVHHFHMQCQVLRNGRYYCPHCGEESEQFEVTLKLDEPRSMTSFEEKYNKVPVPRAKMGIHSSSYRTFSKTNKDPSEDIVTASYKTAQDKTISTGGLPFGPDKTSLEKVVASLSDEKSKNCRKIPKFLYNPAYEGDLEKVVIMIGEGHDPNEKVEDFDNQTPLHAACIGGSLAIVHVLVQVGAFIHAVDKELKTPMMYAAENNHAGIVKYLLKCKANVMQRAEDGMTVLHYAAKAGHVDVLKVLLESDEANVNVQDDGGWTPIIWASEHRIVPAVKFLIRFGADPNMKDKEENTSLHWAAYSGSVDIAEMFLNAGCDLETPNEHGDRPLHIAARQDHYECVVLFLARGADVDAKNKENETPIQCCIDENSQSWLALRVNKQLKGFAAARLGRSDKLIDRDVSRGRENIPIAVINGIDDDPVPTDFQYITENVETTDLNINRTISSLQSCRCSDDCSSMYCVCGRNSVKCWYDKSYQLLPEFNLAEPPLLFECNKGCRCWSTCNNRVVQNGITCRLQMVKTEGRGWGVKTLLDIPKGIFICEYIGELISDSEADGREDDSYLFDLDNRDGDTYCIDARRYGNISRFINHLCEPNIIPVKVFVDHQDLRFPRICFFSSREIKAEEELGFDYGEKFWIIKWKQFTCACNSPKCKYSKDTIQKTLQEYRQRHEEEEPIG